ncbi:MAG: hypothetical protein HKM04_01465 [Legionellales bacterium]|nr:hypothetical protein [Legionellales bacterium]
MHNFEPEKFKSLFSYAVNNKILASYIILQETYDRANKKIPLPIVLKNLKKVAGDTDIFVSSHIDFFNLSVKNIYEAFLAFNIKRTGDIKKIQLSPVLKQLESSINNLDKSFIQHYSAPIIVPKNSVSYSTVGVIISFFLSLFALIDNQLKTDEQKPNYFVFAIFMFILCSCWQLGVISKISKFFEKLFLFDSFNNPGLMGNYNFTKIKKDLKRIETVIDDAIILDNNNLIQNSKSNEGELFPKTKIIIQQELTSFYQNDGVPLPRKPVPKKEKVNQTSIRESANHVLFANKSSVSKKNEINFDAKIIFIRNANYLSLMIPTDSPFFDDTNMLKTAVHGMKEWGVGITGLKGGKKAFLPIPVSLDGKEMGIAHLTHEIHDPRLKTRIYCAQWREYLIPVIESDALHQTSAKTKLNDLLKSMVISIKTCPVSFRSERTPLCE